MNARMMKLVCATILVPMIAAAQETLIGEDVEVGGFGGPSASITRMGGKAALLVGGGGAVVLDHMLSIGGFGYGLTSSVRGNGSTPGTERMLDFGFGGLHVAWMPASADLIHPTIRLLIGAGGVDYRGAIDEETMARKGTQTSDMVIDIDPRFDVFLVVQPGIGVELNLLRFMRVEGSLDYRLIEGVELEGTGDTELSGPSATLTVKFGSF